MTLSDPFEISAEAFEDLDADILYHSVPLEALLLKVDPLGRLAPGYCAAMFALAEAARLRWRATDRDLERLHALGRGDAVSAGWLFCLAAVAHQDPGELPIEWTSHARTTIARVIRVARSMLRHDFPEGMEVVTRALVRSAQDLRWPLETRVYEQWRDAVKDRRSLA